MKKNSLKAVLNMSKLSVAAKINRARIIVESIDANPTVFITPNPDLITLNNAIDELEKAFTDASDGGKTKTAVMHDKEAEVMKLMNDLTAYVQAIADGDESVIHLASLYVKVFRGPGVDAFSVERGENHGEVIVKVKAVRGACYHWQYCPEPIVTNNWIDAGESTQSRILIKGLTPGLVYWFRVAIVDKNGKHPFNTPLSIMVV